MSVLIGTDGSDDAIQRRDEGTAAARDAGRRDGRVRRRRPAGRDRRARVRLRWRDRERRRDRGRAGRGRRPRRATPRSSTRSRRSPRPADDREPGRGRATRAGCCASSPSEIPAGRRRRRARGARRDQRARSSVGELARRPQRALPGHDRRATNDSTATRPNCPVAGASHPVQDSPPMSGETPSGRSARTRALGRAPCIALRRLPPHRPRRVRLVARHPGARRRRASPTSSPRRRSSRRSATTSPTRRRCGSPARRTSSPRPRPVGDRRGRRRPSRRRRSRTRSASSRSGPTSRCSGPASGRRVDIDAQQASTTIRSALQTINPSLAEEAARERARRVGDRLAELGGRH